MRKTVIARPTRRVSFPETELWLDLSLIADVELTSEDPAYPFENCLSLDGSGWRASIPGPQTVRLIFHKPVSLRRLHLEFAENVVERTQELSVKALFTGAPQAEVIRQQWSFSPNDSTLEVEDYGLNLEYVEALELQIDPGRHDKQCLASLKFIALA